MPSTNGQLLALEAEVLYTPPQLRRSHLARIEELILELLPDNLYTYETVFHRVTQFAPDSDGDKLISGRALQQELGRILLRGSSGAPLEATDDTMPMTDAARQCRVTPNTIRRWAAQGLPLAVRSGAAGRIGVSVRASALKEFLDRRKALHALPTRRLTPAEVETICARSKVLHAESVPFGTIIRRLAAESGYSMSTIRRILERERRNVTAARHRAGLPPEARAQLVELYKTGKTLAEIAARTGRSISATRRFVQLAVTEKILTTQVNFMPNPAFDRPDAARLCMAEPQFEKQQAPSEFARPPAETPAYLAELYNVPLLSREGERALFLKYNYLKSRAAAIQERLRKSGLAAGMLQEFEKLREAAEQVRKALIRSNLRLVVSIARRHAGPLANLFDLVSEGNICLMRAVECYDCSRQAKFATYATWAIAKHFARIVPEENYRLASFVTGQQEMIEARGDEREAAHERGEAIEHIRSLITRAAAHLTPREREVIVAHYGTDGSQARTLEEIGGVFGLTRERIRQIEARAIEKLRALIPREAAGLA